MEPENDNYVDEGKTISEKLYHMNVLPISNLRASDSTEVLMMDIQNSAENNVPIESVGSSVTANTAANMNNYSSTNDNAYKRTDTNVNSNNESVNMLVSDEDRLNND